MLLRFKVSKHVFVFPASLASGLRLNGNSVSATWRPVPHTSLVGAVIQVAPETTTITHSDTEAKMGVILYGSAVGESYALPVGLLLHNLNVRDFNILHMSAKPLSNLATDCLDTNAPHPT